MNHEHLTIESPLGPLTLRASEAGLTQIRFLDGEGPRAPEPEGPQGGALVEEAARQLEAYFAGTRTDFDLPLAPEGTDFMKSVWKELLRIPFGATISYGELAQRVGDPNASRAVGSANGKNPLPIVIPCHRVIGADGSLTGFAGGVGLKRRLLDHEGALPETTPSLFGET